MPFSIENMLQLREFKDCTVIAGHKGINRVIQCVDTMEVPDITPWLQCGELLITTGYSLEDTWKGLSLCLTPCTITIPPA